jgi:hypothetical protein
MATLRLSTTARNAAAEAVTTLLDAGSGPGKIELRTGSMPATPQTAATGTLLATVVLSDPQSGAASAGVDTITNPASVTGVADGTAGWARFLDSNNVVVMDCDVTATGGGGSITLSTTTVSTGVTVDLDAITYTQPQG